MAKRLFFRTFRLGLMILIIGTLGMGGGLTVRAQSGNSLPPAIVYFTADLPLVKLTDIEAGTASAALSWQTVGITSSYRVQLYFFRISGWELLTPDALPGAGVAKVVVPATLDFAPPAFRLTIENQARVVVSQQIVVIPYDPSQESLGTVIEEFRTERDTVNYNLLSLGQERVVVTWRVANRSPLSNLIFEQVLPDGSTRSIELPRLSRWISSSGQGLVAPALPSAESAAITIRLRVVDYRTGDTRTQQDVILPVIRGGAAQPTVPAVQLQPTATSGQ
ncbi:MAG TPA: hypothetical protein PLD47_12430 [Aggregatilineales bacterium]|nr:hypothetical protein [Anaerolineales bacterium]HRE48523.1 hypothetical protein [Aggregatilineales bacterium]